MGKGCPDSGGQLVGGVHLGDAEGGPGPHGLHEQGIAQLLRRLGHLGQDGAPAEQAAPGHPHPRQGRQLVGPVLVHAQCAGQGPAAHDGHVHQLQQALDGAVLPVLAVEDGERRVKSLAPAGPIQPQQPPVPPVQGQGAGHTVRLRLPVPGLQVGQAAGIPQPAALPGDAHRQGREPAPVQRLQHAVGGL